LSRRLGSKGRTSGDALAIPRFLTRAQAEPNTANKALPAAHGKHCPAQSQEMSGFLRATHGTTLAIIASANKRWSYFACH
jgi:hypothetical protein